MKAGTIVQIPDGRVGTVVYNGLDGVGIKWGRHSVTLEQITEAAKIESLEWEPEAMLRDSYPHAREVGMECVGDEFVVVTA